MSHSEPVMQVITSSTSLLSRSNLPFLSLFLFRYLRLFVHLISFWLYKPSPVPQKPTVSHRDATVVIPSIDPKNRDFIPCLESILYNRPREIWIVTVGAELREVTESIVNKYRASFPSIRIRVTATTVANKRKQVAHVLPRIRTKVTILVDDHVFWPSTDFLPSVLAPFEDGQVGAVGTNKRVVREGYGFGVRSFWNIIGALYLERHNFEIRASNAVDGGVFVISGRTCAYRTEILRDPAFIQGYTGERFFFNIFGPLNPDDDNFITRWVVRQGWKIKVQYTEDSLIWTTLGTYPKFMLQAVRWARTTFRSNMASLLTDRTVWRAQPWCVYAVYISGMINFALFYDPALLYTLTQTSFYNWYSVKYLVFWILATKMVKTLPFFLRHPSDLIYLPACIGFAYFHSLIKLYALLTFWETNWGGRDLKSFDKQPETAGNISLEHDRSCSSSDYASSLSSSPNFNDEYADVPAQWTPLARNDEQSYQSSASYDPGSRAQTRHRPNFHSTQLALCSDESGNYGDAEFSPRSGQESPGFNLSSPSASGAAPANLALEHRTILQSPLYNGFQDGCSNDRD